MATITLTLPDPLLEFIQAEATADGNVNAYLLNLVRAAQSKAQAARLQALLQEGLATPPIPLDAAFRTALDTRATAITDRARP
jgi:hypothetical protein